MPLFPFGWITAVPCMQVYQFAVAHVQSEQNAASRLFGGVSKFNSVTPTLRDVLPTYWQ